MKDQDDIQQKIKDLEEKEDKKKKKHKKDGSELELLKQQNEELNNQVLRVTADLQNYRRRAEEDKRSMVEYATSSTIQDFLPIVDNFQRSFEHLPPELEKEEWIQGIKHILAQCEQLMAQKGVVEIPVKPGDTVDPHIHEVMAQGEGESGTIVEVLQKGYKMGDKIVRTAKVKAAA